MTKPVILFACVHNGGRSLAAKILAEHHGGDRVAVRSAGSEPGDALNPAVVKELHDRGLSVEGEAPTLLTYDVVQEADWVITMGCGDVCPIFPGKRYLDWDLEDPAGKGVAAVRPIRDEIKARVEALLAGLLPKQSPVSPTAG